MKLSLEPTDEIERVNGTLCRKWKGTTDLGTPVMAWIAIIQPQTHEPERLQEFEEQLRELPPARREPVSFDIRMAI